MSTFSLETSHGLIHITDTGLKNSNPALLCIHGNSSSSKMFRHIFSSPTITSTYRVLAFDLPGHGSSTNAPDPEKSYWMRGYAELAVHILQHLDISRVVVWGWSLGGHIGIEMIPLLVPLAPAIQFLGLMITGTPPALGKEQVIKAFRAGTGGLGIAGQREWSEDDFELFVSFSAPKGKEHLLETFIREDAKRADGRARELMGKRFVDGEGVDQIHVVETTDVLVAVVNGGDEPAVVLDYVDEIKYRKLWRGKCIRMEGLGHAPFWEEPGEFEKVLCEFLGDCAKLERA